MSQRCTSRIILSAIFGISLFAARDLSAGPIQYNVTRLNDASGISPELAGGLNDAGQVAFTVQATTANSYTDAQGETTVSHYLQEYEAKLYDSYGPNAGQVSTIATGPTQIPTGGTRTLYAAGIDAAGNVLLSNNTLVSGGTVTPSARSLCKCPSSPMWTRSARMVVSSRRLGTTRTRPSPRLPF